MRAFQVAVLALATALSVSAQEKRPLALDFPLVDKSCKITQESIGSKPDWVAKCKLYVYRNLNEKVTEGVTLFELPLVQAHPASFEEASKAVGKWLEKSSVEILKRNGYLKEEKGKK